MSSLQHERIVALAEELRLGALPDLYGAVAQSAAGRQDASYADTSWRRSSRPSATPGACGHGRC